MVGNVWEWTHSLFKPYPYKVNDGREDEKSSDARVLRGASFDDIEGNAHCACRFNFDSFFSSVGFRVVASPKKWLKEWARLEE
jgi:formylglycine-generating enzyme required for sulfatase activity